MHPVMAVATVVRLKDSDVKLSNTNLKTHGP
jgi:hypothetical protein